MELLLKISTNSSQKLAHHFQKKLLQTVQTHISHFLIKKITSTFTFDSISEADVRNIIKLLKPKSSTGHDDISTILLKQLSAIIAPSLSLIINESLFTGIFPDRLKIAKVLPLFKKENPHIFYNYRPISLLPALSKIFEKIVYKQLYDYFLCKKLLYNSQYGFRQDHSTELASLELCDRILKYLDEGKMPITIFLDLSKAFDTLDHEILLHNRNPIYVNEDLTGFRASLLYECRKLAKATRIKECWSYFGNIYIKDLTGALRVINKVASLSQY